MSRWEARIQFAANLVVGGTGIIYAIMRYLMDPVDEWAVVNHPWQPHVQHLHVLTAPLLVFACGLIWHRHVVGNLRRDEQRERRTGPGLLLALAPMILSGYLIQTTVMELWRQVWIVVHLTSSAAWILAFAAHLVRPNRFRLFQSTRTALHPRCAAASDRVHQSTAGDE